jgi:retron-type reverse transcriptase
MPQANCMQEEPVVEAKPFGISKRDVWEAFKRVKANQGAAGVDGQSIADFEVDLRNNLYKLWNRLSSGSYFPSPVRRVDIPKADGGTRPLGIPTVADRIAQEVVRRNLEPRLEPVFPTSKAISIASIGSFCSRRSAIIRIVPGCCFTSSAG